MGFNLSLTRRAFFNSALQTVIFIGCIIGFGGIVRLLHQEKSFIRPAGALEEEEFFSHCMKCQRCQQICPMAIITPVILTEDVVKTGTPKLDFTLGYCTFCMKCTEVCPTGALRPIDKEDVRLGLAQIDRERCIAWVWGGCAVCYDACPIQAISLDDLGRPIVNEDICNGCGLCEYSCLVSVLRRYSGVSKRAITVVPIT